MIRTYKDLEVYQKGYQLSLKIHKLTQKLPEFERYEMGSQMRRAGISIPANIAEGYAKKQSTAEFKRFLSMSLGSCNEIQVFIEMCRDLDYMDKNLAEEILESYEVLGKQLNTLMERGVLGFSNF